MNNEQKDGFIENIQVEGRNAVLEAVNNDSPIDKIMFKKGEIEGSLKLILAKAKQKGIVTQEVTKQKLDEISQTHKHQGVIAICPMHEYAEVSDILEAARAKGEDALVIVLDGVTDPHNLGAILRSAEAAGAHGVIVPKRRAASLTAVVAKTSAGAIEYVPVARVTNLTATLKELKKAGLWIAAADASGTSMYKSNLSGPLAIVVGSEGKGVSRLVLSECDFAVSIPMKGKITSLNASVAAAVVLYEAVRRRETGAK